MAFTDVERQMALDIYRDRGATAAAKEIGCSRQTIYDWLADDVSTDESDLKRRAERADVMRGILRDRLLRVAVRLVDRCSEPFVWYDKHGNAHAADEPPGAEVQRLMTAAAIAVDKYRLEMGEHTDRQSNLSVAPIDLELERIIAEHARQQSI